MGSASHRLLVIRHGETEWSKTGKHTGVSDIDLTAQGEEQARSLVGVLDGLSLTRPTVVCSPRLRARRTAELAGLVADHVEPLLVEWDYGDYEGRTSPDIHRDDPGWDVFVDGAPHGESPAQMTDRADAAIARLQPLLDDGDVVAVTHGHFSRAVLARWIGVTVDRGRHLTMLPASVAILGFDGDSRQLTTLGLTGYRSADYVDAGRPTRRIDPRPT